MLSLLEVFTGLKPSPLLVSPMPLRKFKDIAAINEARTRELANITAPHEALDEMHKDVVESSSKQRTRAQKIHNARTSVTPLNIAVGDYVMIRAHARKEHKLQTKWRGPMLVKETKSPLLFVVEDITNAQHLTVHAQRMVPYPVTKGNERASEELLEQASHYDLTYHLVDEIRGIRKRKGSYEVLIRWMGLNNDDEMTWEPLENIRDDLPGILEDDLYTPGDRNLKREIIDLYF